MSFDPTTLATAKPKIIDLANYKIERNEGSGLSENTLENAILECFAFLMYGGDASHTWGDDEWRVEDKFWKDCNTKRPLVLKMKVVFNDEPMTIYVNVASILYTKGGNVFQVAAKNIFWANEVFFECTLWIAYNSVTLRATTHTIA